MISMSKTITLREANQGFSRYMREVEAGEEFVITRKGRPVGRLTPIGGRRVLTPEQEEARARALERMKKGAPLGIKKFNRDEIYEERIAHYDPDRKR
jgi:prevent-host-death family protein